MSLTPPQRLAPIAIAAAAATAVAGLGAAATELGPWYRSLVKPWWQPPDWLFGPAWTLIFALTATSGLIAWRSTARASQRKWLIVLFALNGCLNVLWSVLFFRLKRPDLALVEVVLLWLSIAALIVFIWPIARRASVLLLPYLLWVGFAGFLNYAVVVLNPQA